MKTPQSTETPAKTLARLANVQVTEDQMAEIDAIESVQWKRQTWGMSWDELGIVARVWLGYPRVQALARINAMMRPGHVPDYESLPR